MGKTVAQPLHSDLVKLEICGRNPPRTLERAVGVEAEHTRAVWYPLPVSTFVAELDFSKCARRHCPGAKGEDLAEISASRPSRSDRLPPKTKENRRCRSSTYAASPGSVVLVP